MVACAECRMRCKIDAVEYGEGVVVWTMHLKNTRALLL